MHFETSKKKILNKYVESLFLSIFYIKIKIKYL